MRLERTSDDRPSLSIVAPCFNEVESLPTFVERATQACVTAGVGDFELVLVNDGSDDRTWETICELASRQSGIVGVNLARNYGHQLAASAGLSLCRGDRVLLIDADLQDPPELLAALMSRMDEGYDVVYARRRKRPQESAFKLGAASAFYRVLDALSEVRIPVEVGDFRLMTRRVVDRLNALPESDRFIRGMVAWLGGRQAELLYDREPRFAGQTGYTLAKMLRLAAAGITSFSTAPLRLAIWFAGLGALVAGGLILYILIGFLVGRTTPGWTSLALMTAFFGIGQFACMAIIGAYLGRVFVQVKGRPLFYVDEIVGSPIGSPLQATRARRAD
ncbi:MAG TPA: glycosyltransferase family 2 protein [Phenylobacterium sp.]